MFRSGARIDHDPPKDSPFTTEPKKVPVDWFDPTYWNEMMTMKERWNIVKKGVVIALPAAEHLTLEKWSTWKHLNQADFMEKFGKKVLEAYSIPSKEDIARLEAYEKEEKEGEGGDAEDDREGSIDIDV